MFVVLLLLAVANLALAVEAMASAKDQWIVLHAIGAMVASLGAHRLLEDREQYQ